MKKTKLFCVVLIALMAIPAIAQKKADKNVEYLPKAGDMSIGISANPLINFAGNMFNGTRDQSIGDVGGSVLESPTLDHSFYPTVSVMGKYMYMDNLGFKVNIGFIVDRDNQARYVKDDLALILDPLSQAKMTDKMRQVTNGGSISLGTEYRIGKRRIQGVFSGSLMYAFNNISTKYTYGNAITEVNQRPTINTIWDDTAQNQYVPMGGSMPHARALNVSSVGYHSIGLVLGVGIEWFVAPKVSLGAEVNIAAIYTSSPSTDVEYEGYNINTKNTETYTNLISPRTSSFTFGTRNIGGNLSVNFYF